MERRVKMATKLQKPKMLVVISDFNYNIDIFKKTAILLNYLKSI